MQRVALLDGENINHDHDITAMYRSMAHPGIVEGLEVQSGKVTPGSAFIEVVRSGKKITVLYENSTDVVIDTTGTKKVFVEINQSSVDNGIHNAENGEGIGEIKTASSYPTSNFLPLASITSGVITDERIFIKGKNVMRTALPNNAILTTDASGSEQATQELPEPVVQSLTETDAFGNGVIAKSGHTITGTLQEDIAGVVPVVSIHNQTLNTGNALRKVSYSLSGSGWQNSWSEATDTNAGSYAYGGFATNTVGIITFSQSVRIREITLHGQMHNNSLLEYSLDGGTSWILATTLTQWNDSNKPTHTIVFSEPITAAKWRFSCFPYQNRVYIYDISMNEYIAYNGIYRAGADVAELSQTIGFLQGPKSQGDTVSVAVSEFAPIKGMSGLTANTIYYLGNTPGTLSTSPGTHKRIVGYTLDDPTVLITYSGKYLPGSNLIKDIT